MAGVHANMNTYIHAYIHICKHWECSNTCNNLKELAQDSHILVLISTTEHLVGKLSHFLQWKTWICIGAQGRCNKQLKQSSTDEQFSLLEFNANYFVYFLFTSSVVVTQKTQNESIVLT